MTDLGSILHYVYGYHTKNWLLLIFDNQYTSWNLYDYSPEDRVHT